MAWNAVTYIRDNPENLEPEVLKELNQLITVRDQVFFPDYKKYNYIPKEPIIRIDYDLRMFRIDLISLQNNRSLDINYSWLHEVDPLRGSFTYSINQIHSEKGYGNVMQVPLLAKNVKT